MKKRINASDLLDSLGKDPDFIRSDVLSNSNRRERETELAAAQKPLIEELEAAGIHISSVWDLVNSMANQSRAVPILVKHLRRAYPEAVREGIARALAVPEARDFVPDLIEELKLSEADSQYRWALACAIAGSVDRESAAVVETLALDEDLGWTRAAFLPYLLKSKGQRSAQVLQKLQQRPEFKSEIRRLSRLLL